MRCVVFDLDGTLADTSGDLIAAANTCFRKRGAGDLLDPLSDAATAFRGARAMLREGFSRMEHPPGDDAVEEDYPQLLEAYGAAIDVHTNLYPGAAEAVERLREAGYATAICTNKPERLADDLVRRLGVRELFGALIGADTLSTRKPDMAPYVAAVEQAGGVVATSLIVGDTETDRHTATAAGVPCILVTFGPDGADVARHAPEALLPHYGVLDEMVARLIG